MQNQVNKPGNPENVQELYEYWLTLPHPKIPNKTNADRSETDKANFLRALKDFALGFQGTEDLKAIHSSFLGDDPIKIQEVLMRGMEQRLGRSPDNQYASSIRARMNGLLRDIAELYQERQMRPVAGKRLWKKYREVAPRFSHKNWPPQLKVEFDTMVQNLLDEYYVGPGQEHFQNWNIHAQSLESYRKAANRLVRYKIEDEGMEDFGLKELTDYDLIQRYRRHYLGPRDKGGHNAFDSTTRAIAAITRYLVMTGELISEYDPFSKHKDAPWIKLYRLGTKTLQQGIDTGKTNPLEPKKSLTIQQMLEAADLMWKTKPRTLAYKENGYQVFRWYMAATVFRLMTVMPVRAKNWVNMKWNENLRRNVDGHWEIYFGSHELKNGRSGRTPREYHTVLPSFVDAWIEQWRKQLAETIGPDFEQRCPYVFPACSRKYDADYNPQWGGMQTSSFYRLIRDVTMEIFNQRYHPHHFRHDVAEAVLTKPGAGIIEAVQAAHLLGDSLETVMKKYFKPNTQEKLDNDYFSDLAKRIEDDNKD